MKKKKKKKKKKKRKRVIAVVESGKGNICACSKSELAPL